MQSVTKLPRSVCRHRHRCVHGCCCPGQQGTRSVSRSCLCLALPSRCWQPHCRARPSGWRRSVVLLVTYSWGCSEPEARLPPSVPPSPRQWVLSPLGEKRDGLRQPCRQGGAAGRASRCRCRVARHGCRSQFPPPDGKCPCVDVVSPRHEFPSQCAGCPSVSQSWSRLFGFGLCGGWIPATVQANVRAPPVPGRTRRRRRGLPCVVPLVAQRGRVLPSVRKI